VEGHNGRRAGLGFIGLAAALGPENFGMVVHDGKTKKAKWKSLEGMMDDISGLVCAQPCGMFSLFFWDGID